MPILHAIVLGITQGLSEFLPISSSGHLKLVPWLFNWDDFAGREGLEQAFDVALHMGTFVGVIAYFRRDIVALIRAGLAAVIPGGRGADDESRLAWLLVLSAVPAAITGAVLESVIQDFDSPVLIGVMLIMFGLVLYWADRLAGAREIGAFRTRDAVLMGAGQALALQPGVSRSGATMTVGRWLGFDRDAAARISFLMSIPIIAGAGLFEAVDVFSNGGVPASFRPAFLWGMAMSAVTGWIAVWFTLRLVRTRTFLPFVIYRVALGTAVLVIGAAGLR